MMVVELNTNSITNNMERYQLAGLSLEFAGERSDVFDCKRKNSDDPAYGETGETPYICHATRNRGHRESS